MKNITIIAVFALTMDLNASEKGMKTPTAFQLAILPYELRNATNKEIPASYKIESPANDTISSSKSDKSSSFYKIEAPLSDIDDMSSLSGTENFSSLVTLTKPNNLPYKDHKNFIGFLYGLYRQAASTQKVIEKKIPKSSFSLEETDVWNYSKYTIDTLNPEVKAIIHENAINGFELNYLKDEAVIRVNSYQKNDFNLRKKTLQSKGKSFLFYAQK